MKVKIKQIDSSGLGLLYVIETEEGLYWNEDLDRFSTQIQLYNENDAKEIAHDINTWWA